ncbi:Glutathione S-transferase [Apodemus speciosus]|uniref:glutathione transferase n=1 Tax=Apodemus speciosus TaxID=105296 RepID=A0ABQ0ELT0_APOSI
MTPDYDRSQWLNEKFKLGLDFPNLPYLIDGSPKVTQSNAILRYLGRKHNLLEKKKPEYLEGLPEKMKLYSEFLDKQPWFAGNKVTYVDFLVYDVLDQHHRFEPKWLDAFPNLKDFMARFECPEDLYRHQVQLLPFRPHVFEDGPVR